MHVDAGGSHWLALHVDGMHVYPVRAKLQLTPLATVREPLHPTPEAVACESLLSAVYAQPFAVHVGFVTDHVPLSHFVVAESQS